MTRAALLTLATILMISPALAAPESDSLADARGGELSLSDLTYRGWLVIQILPTLTPDQVAQRLNAMRRYQMRLEPIDTRPLLVTTAKRKDLTATAAGRTFPVLCDPTGTIARRHGLWDEAENRPLPGWVVLDFTLRRRAVMVGAPTPRALAARVALLQDTVTNVDLRPGFSRWKLPVRRQGPRPTCSVVTTTAALEYAWAVRRGVGQPLSVEYLNWTANQVINNRTRDRGQFFHILWAGFERHGVCSSVAMPYTRRWDPKRQPSAAALQEAKTVKGLELHWLKAIKTPKGATPVELRAIRLALARGWPVGAGSHHSVLLVGYRVDPTRPGGGELITHDSGPGAARTMSFGEAARRLNDVFYIRTTPTPWAGGQSGVGAR